MPDAVLGFAVGLAVVVVAGMLTSFFSLAMSTSTSLDAQFEPLSKDTRELREGIEKLRADCAELSVQIAEFGEAVSAYHARPTMTPDA